MAKHTERTEDLRVRVSTEEKRTIEEAAEKDGQKTAAWLRSLALRAARESERKSK